MYKFYKLSKNETKAVKKNPRSALKQSTDHGIVFN